MDNEEKVKRRREYPSGLYLQYLLQIQFLNCSTEEHHISKQWILMSSFSWLFTVHRDLSIDLRIYLFCSFFKQATNKQEQSGFCNILGVLAFFFSYHLVRKSPHQTLLLPREYPYPPHTTPHPPPLTQPTHVSLHALWHTK